MTRRFVQVRAFTVDASSLHRPLSLGTRPYAAATRCRRRSPSITVSALLSAHLRLEVVDDDASPRRPADPPTNFLHKRTSNLPPLSLSAADLSTHLQARCSRPRGARAQETPPGHLDGLVLPYITKFSTSPQALSRPQSNSLT